MDDMGAGPRARAIRLIFEYRADAVRLVTQVPVDLELTEDEGPGPDGSYYVELRDADGGPLRQVNVLGHGPVRFREVFGPPGSAITRVPVEEPNGAFTVLVPAVDGARTVALLQQDAGAGSGPAEAGPADAGPAAAPGGRRGVELMTAPLTVGDER